MRKRISQKEVTDFVEAVLFSVAFIAQREAWEEGWDGKITTPVSAPVTLDRLQAMAQAYFLRHAVERGEVSTCVSHWAAIAPREAWQKRINRAVTKALIDLNVVFEQVAWSPADALKPLAGHTYMRIVRDYAGSNSYVNSQYGFALHMNPRKYAQCVEVRRIRIQENTGSQFSEYSTEAAVKKQLISETRKDLMDVRSALSIPEHADAYPIPEEGVNVYDLALYRNFLINDKFIKADFWVKPALTSPAPTAPYQEPPYQEPSGAGSPLKKEKPALMLAFKKKGDNTNGG